MAESPRRAAVLVPLCRGAGGVEVILTRRAEGLPTHPGQVSFPGGRYDPTRDDSLLATALREAGEEIGLRTADAEVLGALPAVATLSSGFEIHPFVARIPSGYCFALRQGEVAEVFRMPLAAHADAALRTTHRWSVAGRSVEVPAILFAGKLVWGATLRILDLLVVGDVVSKLFKVTE
jgi:8-oxo-dGTP pyrophosphatase MutT (NUDIX family)